MIDGGLGIQNKLYNDAVLVSHLATITTGVPAIYNARAIPPEFTKVPVINYYRVDPVEGGNEIDQFFWSINCRANNEEDAEHIGIIVFELLKRTSATVGGYEYFFIPSLLPTLPPMNSVDNFNTPVEVIVKARKM